MGKIKILFQQVCMISTGTLFVIGINGAVSCLTGESFDFPWYYPFSIILLGLLCALPTHFFILDKWGRAEGFVRNLILHWLSLWAVTAAVGWIFQWYSTLEELLVITVEYTVVYIFVWTASLWSLREEDRKINQAIMDIQDEE